MKLLHFLPRYCGLFAFCWRSLAAGLYRRESVAFAEDHESFATRSQDRGVNEPLLVENTSEESCLINHDKDNNDAAEFSSTMGCDIRALLVFLTKELKHRKNCAHSAAKELQLLTGASSLKKAHMIVDDACARAWDEIKSVSLVDSLVDGSTSPSHAQFVKEFFDGGTYWNEERETSIRINHNQIKEVNILKKNPGTKIQAVQRELATSKLLEWPDKGISNFRDCRLQSAMCCWVQDRQANDNNGNCAEPYDEKCVNADPANNGDICYVDAARAPQSSRVKGVYAIFEGLEGATHCHGFAWGHDENEFSARYKANALFHVSLQDHLLTRGYVRNVPGAPMCACLEQMPVVSRADCTELKVTQTTTWSFNGTASVSVVLHDDAKINTRACVTAKRNNDLLSYYEKLVNETRVTPKLFDHVHEEHIVGKKNCTKAVDLFMKEKGWVRSKPSITSSVA